MGYMFDKTRDQMNNWRWDNPRAFGDQVDLSNPQTASSGKVTCTGERFSSYASDVFRAKIEQPGCRQYKPSDFLVVRPLNWDEIINEDDDEENWADTGVQSSRRSCRGDGNNNDDGESEEDTEGGVKGTRKKKGTTDGKARGKATEDRKGKGKGTGMGNGKEKGIVKPTPEGDDISHAVALQLQKEMSEPDLDTEG
jgi:hypothetical protein